MGLSCYLERLYLKKYVRLPKEKCNVTCISGHLCIEQNLNLPKHILEFFQYLLHEVLYATAGYF